MSKPNITRNIIVNEYQGEKLEYEVNKVVIPNRYDDVIDHVCSWGVHYFKSPTAAYYYSRVMPNMPKQTGKWCQYYDNGVKDVEGYFLNGDKHDTWTCWDENSIKQQESIYINGKLEGRFIAYGTNGRKIVEGKYRNGQKTGIWIEYDSNVDAIASFLYNDGIEIGKIGNSKYISTSKL